MLKYFKLGLVLLGLAIGGYIGWNMYLYYFDESAPVISIVGIDDGQSYAGDVMGTLSGHDTYKVSTISMWLDGKTVKEKQSINKQNFEYKIVLPVENMEDGKHELKIEVIDGTKRGNSTVMQRSFVTDNAPLQAAFVKPSSQNKVLQGRCLHVQFQVNKPVKKATLKALSHEYPCYPENEGSLVYEAFLPIECDQHASEYIFSVHLQDAVGNNFTLEDKFQVVSYPFKKKTLVVQSGVLEKEREFTEFGENDFEKKMEELTKQSVQKKLWQGPFEIPLAMTRITTEFGVIRVAQERGRYAHKALDIVSAAPKSVVWASQSGVVVLKDRYVHAGNAVVIDHGWGILSLYFHLDEFASIEVGQKIKKGKPVGTMGKTGYAKGYHLHWEMRVNNVAIDPMQWTKRDFIN